MKPATINITIRQGSTWRLELVWKDSNGVPVDLTGYVARMQIRKSVSATTAAVTLTTENGRITLGGATGRVGLVLDAATTAALSLRAGVHDLELEASDGTVTALCAGEVEIEREVTRA